MTAPDNETAISAPLLMTPTLSRTHGSVSVARPRNEVISTRFKQLPLISVIIGALLAPLFLLVEYQGVTMPNTTSYEQNTMTTSSYVYNADGTVNLLHECQERYFTQPLDHFTAMGGPSYEQRYFVCNQHSRTDGAIFFYVGNEADVELYLNNTGLMWENAQEFGALLVFAEHRYFGKSVPFGSEVRQHMQYLSSEQALADYAVLITSIKETYRLNVPVIGFGGSYGGMLASWFRMKYPHIVDGVIAASAPILAFMGDEKPVDMESFARITTFDASPEAGSADNCIPNIRQAWKTLDKLGKTVEGRKSLLSAFNLCDSEKLETEDDVVALAEWAKSAYDYMAMGNYPYPSPYIMNGQSILPAFPVRVACSYLKDQYTPEDELGLLNAFRNSLGVYHNSTNDQQCYHVNPPSNASAQDGEFWQYLYCSELYMPSSTNGIDDMFWSVPWNITIDDQSCMEQWGIHLRPEWAVTQYGGRKALQAASNMVLSNGNYDPWSGTGVLTNVSDSVVNVSVEGGAHHLDLFFHNELDPPAILQAREIEKTHMWKWVKTYYEQ